MTLEEALAASEAEPVNDIFTVNPESRTITVPDTEKIFGVFSDGNTERKHFRCPKVVGDGIDLTTLHLYINYQNANGKKISVPCRGRASRWGLYHLFLVDQSGRGIL
jgi:hypothetical protein